MLSIDALGSTFDAVRLDHLDTGLVILPYRNEVGARLAELDQQLLHSQQFLAPFDEVTSSASVDDNGMHV